MSAQMQVGTSIHLHHRSSRMQHPGVQPVLSKTRDSLVETVPPPQTCCSRHPNLRPVSLVCPGSGPAPGLFNAVQAQTSFPRFR